ncbi:MAG: hypothetical protein BIFFINMI_04028 [Phycisphaerae bacterium]|nr:hypothetical protein [Phycisphaerae bacterium]
MNKTGMVLVVGLAILAGAASAWGQGLLVPTDTTLPPLAIKSQQVSISIDNQVATTTVKQVFMNSTGRQLEANYVFPMPAQSTIRDFSMMMDGKKVSGELVEAKEARRIYTQIVSQMRDPGLLEHLGDNLFRVNIFPVPANGTQTIELTYSEVVKGNGGVYRYVYPLRTGSKASQVQDYFSVGAKLASKVAIKSVYSPTHEIGVTRKGDHAATVGLEINKAILDRDFSLYWTVSDKDFGLNAVAHRADEKQPGYLMLLISPKSAVNDDEIVAKDVQFVFDTSGSMSGDKIEQAKKALRYCIENLAAKDRFNIISFATDVTPFKEGLVEASKENRRSAIDYVNKLQAQGGTNIHDALDAAMKTARAQKDRPQIVVFLTDGRPTIGNVETKDIVGLIGSESKEAAAKAEHVRVFTFGVGNDVNTKLLDQVAGKSGGLPEYVGDGEDIEVKVSDFFAKASHPVMTGLSLAFSGSAKIDDMLPKALPDLYFGQQIVAFARYDGAGDVAVTLSGTVSNGKTEKHTYEVALPGQTTESDFVEPLWANRKVGFLLDQIRLNGESKELKDEVIRLSKAYRIQTPYTSYLVLEEQHRRQYLDRVASGNDYDRDGRRWRSGREGQDAPPPPTAPDTSVTPVTPGVTTGNRPDAEAPARPAEDQKRLETALDMATRTEGDGGGHGGPRGQKADPGSGGWADNAPADEVLALRRDALEKESGEAAVEVAKDIARKKQADKLDDAGKFRAGYYGVVSQEAGGRTFYALRGFWIDGDFDGKAKLTFVKWGSEAYFDIVSAHVELKDAFALGKSLIVVTAEGRALVVSETEGEEKLTEEQVKALFTAVAPTTQPAE